jgi:SNF2 family DNA or RNA helicase
MLSRDNLHAYQNKAIDFIKDKKRCALFLDLGLGKTATSLTTISDMIDSFTCSKVLIIAPLRVANSVWAQEASKWSHTKHLRVSVVTGSEKKRLSALQFDADVYVINRENIPWLVKHYGKRFPFDAIFVDESSSFKNATSKRFKALKAVSSLTDYMVLLTGTPSPNGLIDLWAQMYLVDYGASLGKTLTAYRDRYFETDYHGFSYKIRAGASQKIHEAISDKVISMQAADYLELPEKIILTELLELPEQAQTAYDTFEKELFLTLADGQELEAMNAAVLANKLLQFCSGATYTDANGNYSVLHDVKIEALKELVEQNDEPMLVAYNFKSDLERLLKAFPDAVVLDKDPNTINRWNNGGIKMLLAHPQSAGHGLNLQHGGSLMVWFSMQWNLEYYQQFNARLYRQGQTKPVRVVHLIAKGCLDERVIKVLNSKDANQLSLLNALKCL